MTTIPSGVQPLGVVRIAVQSAHIRPWPWFMGNSPNAFLTVSTQQERNMARTKHNDHSFEPTWMETLYIVIHPQDEFLEFGLYNHHEHRSATMIGSTRFSIPDIVKFGELTGLNIAVSKGGRNKADLLSDMTFYPLDSRSGDASTSAAGIVSIDLFEAAELETVDRRSGVYAQVSLGSNGVPMHQTQRRKGNRPPVWNTTFDFFSTHSLSTTVTIKVIGSYRSEMLGYLSLCLEDILDSGKMGVEWWPLNGCTSGKVRFAVRWWPVGKII